MKKILVIIIVFLVYNCRSPELHIKPVYIYDSGQLFNLSTNSNDSLVSLNFKIRKPFYKYVDTFLVATNYKYYYLIHYFKFGDYKDSVFIKHKSYLDTINCYNSKRFSDEEKLDSFWNPSACWRCGGIYDTTQIYLIQPIENTDSLKFLQVHRWFFKTQ